MRYRLPFILFSIISMLLLTGISTFAGTDMDETLSSHDPAKDQLGGPTLTTDLGRGSDECSANKTGTVKVSTSLNIRSGPWGKIIGKFHNGDKVTIVGKQGAWYKITWNGKTAYVHSNYVKVDGDATSGSTTAGTTGNNDTTGTTGSTNSTSGTTTAGTPPVTGPGGAVKLTVPQKCQIYVNCPAPMAACGPTALGMMMAYYKGGDPGTWASKMYKAAGTTSGGSSYTALANAAKAEGFPNTNWQFSVGLSWIRAQLQKGNPIMAYVAHHYIVIKGIDSSGKVIINDPGKGVVERTMSFDQLSGWWNGGGLTRAAMVMK
ncbi:MAG: SH3 domain-containing protein [Candidatus Ozemobacteraceae bacterium]